MNERIGILERFKRSFGSIPRLFWLREYGIASLIFSGFLGMCYIQSDYPLSVTFLFLLNTLLFPFTKYLAKFCLEWFYRLVYQAELHQVSYRVGCFTIVFKMIRNVVLFFFSFFLGWIGLAIVFFCVKREVE